METAHPLLTANDIILDLNANSKDDAILQLSKIMLKNHIVTNDKKFFEDVEKREKMTTTGMEHGIAIPHGKSSVVTRPAMLFAKNKTPLEWNSLDGSKVTLIFLMAVPENDGDKAHLKMLAHLSAKLIDSQFISKLRKTTNKESIIKLLES